MGSQSNSSAFDCLNNENEFTTTKSMIYLFSHAVRIENKYEHRLHECFEQITTKQGKQWERDWCARHDQYM
jgi:hypothetical protein